MAVPDKKKSHLYSKVARALAGEIAKGKFPAHGLFHSERETARRFGISVLTARRVYEVLERRRLIYRVHGKGTFVAPRSRTRRILVVLDLQTEQRFASRDFDRVDFFLGAMEGAQTRSEDHEVVAIREAPFRAILGELRHHQPDLSGVIFFRNTDLILEAAPVLRAEGVPFLFYGSSQHRSRLSDIHGRFYEESEINALALDHLWHRKRRRIAVAYIDAGASAVRRTAWQDYLTAKGSPPRPEWALRSTKFYGSFHEELQRVDPGVFRSIDGLYCTVDSFAADAVQHLLQLGLRVPEDVAVVTVNDSPACLQIHPNLSTVAIPLFEDAGACVEKILDLVHGKDRSLHDRSPVSLIHRKSS